MELLFLPRLRHCLLLRRPFRRRLFLGVRLQQLSSSTSTSNSASECEGETVAEAPFGYDPNLKLVAGLSGPVDADDVSMERPPFRLDGVEKVPSPLRGRFKPRNSLAEGLFAFVRRTVAL